MEMHLNWFALVSATVVGIVVANLWYAPFLFGKIWMEEVSKYIKEPAKAKERTRRIYGLFYIYIILAALVLSDVIFVSQNYYGGDRYSLAAATAFKLWIGLVAPIQFLDFLGEGKSLKLYMINAGFQLTILLAMSFVFAFFK